jgi:acyl-CoA reductase-like NAD-dependent aldehyde dehydrogenase
MSQKDLEYWQTMAHKHPFEGRAVIDGTLVPALSGRTFECISPIDGRLLTKVAACQGEDIGRAVANARAIFDAGVWRDQSPAQRKKVLLRLARLIDAHQEELALLETLDVGKPIRDSLAIDIPASVRALTWSAEAVDKLYGEIAPTPVTELGLITREPLGVIAAIVPWNFPLLMAIWKLGPALAAGNAVVLKPSEKSPLTALRVAQLALEAGLPPGVLNVVPGMGDPAGRALAEHMDVDGLVFTGSTATGKQLLQMAGASNMKRTYLECGGKTANIVFADTPDLDRAAMESAWGIFFNQGEVCTAGSRLLVQRDIADSFVERLMAQAQRIQPGHPLDPHTRMGALVDEGQCTRVMSYITTGRQDARLAMGGQQVRTDSGGWYVEPTIFTGVDPDSRIAQEEIFGPVLSVIPFDTEEEAVAIANGTIYGLAAAAWTADLSRALRVSRDLRAGSVWINGYDQGDMTAPFGGYKQSGNGRDKSLHAFDKYTELKATWIRIAP